MKSGRGLCVSTSNQSRFQRKNALAILAAERARYCSIADAVAAVIAVVNGGLPAIVHVAAGLPDLQSLALAPQSFPSNALVNKVL